MSEIDSDYLWLSQRPRPRKRLRKFILLLLCLPLTVGAVWLFPGNPHADQAHEVAPSDPARTVIDPTTLPQLRLSTPSKAQPTQASAEPDTRPATPDTTHAANSARTVDSLQSELRIEPGMLLTPTRDLLYNADHVAATPAVLSKPVDDWTHIRIRKGDTLSTAFARHGLAYADSLAIAHLAEYGKHFIRQLRAGDTLNIKADNQGHVLALEYPLDDVKTLHINTTDGGYSASIERADLDQRSAYITGVIHSSFYRAARQAGLTDRQIMQLADIFKWTVNFGYDIHPGDRFSVVYSELYKDGTKVADGHILAASFKTDQKTYRAVRFTSADGETAYYRPDGSSLKRAFIRVPVDYTRISSPFTRARKHPILHKIRAHEGTDYAAPRGTPIHASSSGKITYRGRNGGYGNMVAIDHGRGITTRYGHMSRFASGQHVGSRVKQGDVIGYVGATGLATGPHLHYEFRIDGTPENPETVDLPGKPPLADKYMARFKKHAKPLIAELKTVSNTTLAQNDRQGVVHH